MSDDNKFALDGQIEGGDNRNSSFKVPFVIFLILFLAALAYILISEYNGPLIGNGLKMRQANEKLEVQHKVYRHTIDSLLNANDLLLEQTNVPDGVWYEVQIGAFEYFNLDEYNNNLVMLRNQQSDGIKKYVLARFREFSRAEAFVNDMRKLGIPDAFITGVIDGTRTDIESAKNEEILRKR